MSENNNYTDTNFNLYQAYSYTLLIQVEAATFSYAVAQRNRLLVSAQNCDLAELNNQGALTELLSATYRKTVIGLPATGLTLVPKSLFSENHVADFARYLDVRENEKVLAQKLDDQNMIIYKTNAGLIDAVQKYNLQNTVYTAAGWIKAVSKYNPPNTNLYMELGKETVQFAYFSIGNLRFYNTFIFKSPDELAYYTTFVTEELHLKPQATTLVLSGNIGTSDNNMIRLVDFFPKIEISQLKVLDLPSQLSPHKLLSLAALSLCGSSEVY